ncbi:unnamed protein product [Ambrosiozyma monospora]|uniref:Serine-threonine kinase receptor-associated protein n=1 Tax=Ambrosiozyma monospora TaxID=43982 RepID=A0A9W7DJY8_AMBMO|nr:unnamed protein product [Ambrosiozyma monospora]
MGQKASVRVLNVNQKDPKAQDDQAVLTIINEEDPKSKYSVAGWSYGDLYLIVGHANGNVSKFDSKTGELLQTVEVHEGLITDIQFSEDRSYFVTSSKDKTAKLLDVDNLHIFKKYGADAPMNSACITPVKEFVILGGGQDARDVTTTSSSEGKFEARFYHKIFEDEIGRVKGHFGPLNYVAIHPNGTSYASGGEDGYIRLHHFHKSYFDFLYDVEKTAQSQVNNLQKEIEA